MMSTLLTRFRDSCDFLPTRPRYLREGATITLKHRVFPCELLPALHCHVDIPRIKLDAVATRPTVSAAISVVPLPKNGS